MNETKLNWYVKEFTAIFVVWVAFFVLVVKKFLKPGQDIFYHFFLRNFEPGVGIRAARPGPVFFQPEPDWPIFSSPIELLFY